MMQSVSVETNLKPQRKRIFNVSNVKRGLTYENK